MDAYEEMLASQRGDEPVLAPSVLTDGLAAALFTLVSEWEREAAFLSNPNDHPQDKAVGKTYAECAAKLRAAIGGYRPIDTPNEPEETHL